MERHLAGRYCTALAFISVGWLDCPAGNAQTGETIINVGQIFNPPDTDPNAHFRRLIEQRIADKIDPFNQQLHSWILLGMNLSHSVAEPVEGTPTSGATSVNTKIYPVENCLDEKRTPPSTSFRLSTTHKKDVTLETTLQVEDTITVNVGGEHAFVSGSNVLHVSFTIRNATTESDEKTEEDSIALDQIIKPESVLFVRLSREVRHITVPFTARVIFDGDVLVRSTEPPSYDPVVGSRGPYPLGLRLSQILPSEGDRTMTIRGHVDFPDVQALRQTYAGRSLTKDEVKRCLKMTEGESGLSWENYDLGKEFERAERKQRNVLVANGKR